MLDLDSVRQVANRHGFSEVQFNEVSRVIAFEKESPRCRVNVYYTTGTVATCLDHPRSGKTQLFRRGQTLDDLDVIFGNPRQHTGVGYFRSKGNTDWQPVDSQGSRHRTFHKSECDDARRWRYIQSTQEGFCNESQANQIAALCKLWHQLRFAPPNGRDIMTTADKFSSMPPEELASFNQGLVEAGYSEVSICQDCEEKGCKCTERTGAFCSLIRVVAKVAFITDGVAGVVYSKDDKTDIKGIYELLDCQCDDGILFRQRHSKLLGKLERQFRSFPLRIRRELIHWFITKTVHGYEPFIMNPNYDPSDEDSDDNGSVELCGFQFCSNSILAAHHDYGEIAYADGMRGCNCHGI